MNLTPRRWVLTGLLLILLVIGVPPAIRRIIQTGDLYLFSERFFDDMLARLSGPGRMRFIFQPIVAIWLGTRDGKKDFLAGLPPFLWSLAFHAGRRKALLSSAFGSIYDVVVFAIILDMVSQFLIFHNIHPGAALILGPVLIFLPYAVSRALANRMMSAHRRPAPRHT